MSKTGAEVAWKLTNVDETLTAIDLLVNVASTFIEDELGDSPNGDAKLAAIAEIKGTVRSLAEPRFLV